MIPRTGPACSAGFLGKRVDEISRGGKLRFTLLQLQPGRRRCRVPVGERRRGVLGTLVVTVPDDLPSAIPVIKLADASPADEPAELLGRLLRERLRMLDDRAPTPGFLTWPVNA